MKIVTILGARPNFVKAYLISKEFKKRGHQEIIVHTGQHYDYQMSEVFFKDLHIPTPDYNLNLRGTQINEMIKQIGAIIRNEKPNLTLVYGDTNSTLAGAISSFLNNTPIAHVEAGERCYDFEMPEERNRVIIDHYSHWLFCSTRVAIEKLNKEGVTKNVYFTGNVMYDSVLYNKDNLKKQTILEKFDLKPKEYVLLTLHRPQNVDSIDTIKILLKILQTVKYPIILPLHPRTKKSLSNFGLLEEFKKNVISTEPMNYLDTLAMIKNAKFVLTDSGGVQAESFCLNTPCISFLNDTAWTETVETGWNKIVALDEARAIQAIGDFSKTTPAVSSKPIFGDGTAYLQIIDILETHES